MIAINTHLRTASSRGALVVGAALAIVALMFPAAAAAERDCTGPTGDQYCPQVEVVANSGSGDPSGDPAGGLPFTGLDLGLILALGAGLVATGIVLRRGSGSGTASE